MSLYVHKCFACRLLLLARRMVRRLQFLCNLLITDQFRFDFICLSTLFNSFVLSCSVKVICGLFSDRNSALPCRHIKRKCSLHTVQHRKCSFQR